MYLCIMAKYRITSETCNQRSRNTAEYFIERKRWFGWQRISKKEDVNEITLRFKTYEEAETYMIDNYFGHGYFKNPYPNEYHYKE